MRPANSSLLDRAAGWLPAGNVALTLRDLQPGIRMRAGRPRSRVGLRPCPLPLTGGVINSSITPPLRGSRRSRAEWRRLLRWGVRTSSAQWRGLVRRRGFAPAKLGTKADPVGGGRRGAISRGRQALKGRGRYNGGYARRGRKRNPIGWSRMRRIAQTARLRGV